MVLNLNGTRGWLPSSLADKSAFQDLVRYAKTVNEKDPPTYFYSPVLERVEAIHSSGRKTFPKAISPELFHQWVEGQLIQVLGQSQEHSWDTGRTTSLVAFVLQETALASPAAGFAGPIFGSLDGWMHRVFPTGWRGSLSSPEAGASLRKQHSHD